MGRANDFVCWRCIDTSQTTHGQTAAIPVNVCYNFGYQKSQLLVESAFSIWPVELMQYEVLRKWRKQCTFKFEWLANGHEELESKGMSCWCQFNVVRLIFFFVVDFLFFLFLLVLLERLGTRHPRPAWFAWHNFRHCKRNAYKTHERNERTKWDIWEDFRCVCWSSVRHVMRWNEQDESTSPLGQLVISRRIKNCRCRGSAMSRQMVSTAK